MPPLLDWLRGKDKKEEEKPKAAPQRVSEETARKRREELARDKKRIEEARKRFEAQEKKRLEAEKAKTTERARPRVQPASAKKATERARPRVHRRRGDKKAAEKAKGTYVVKSGDSLSKIAKEVYKDAKRWPEIYEANKKLIGDNPNLIKPGQKLIIP